MFAIVTFRNTGPIKTWSAMRAANVHNARTVPLTHAVDGAPKPEHLIGTGDLVADVKAKLRAVDIDPDRLRKNGVIAYEAILTASAEFFEQGDEAEREGRLAQWKAAQRDWAVKRYGHHRIASMVLHQDEKTPHIHLVVVPLAVKSDKRRRDPSEVRWGLAGRTISGPGRFDELQDDYAAAMEPFGLRRGVRGSGRKHEPVPVYLARMAAKEQAVDVAAETLQRDQLAAAADRRHAAEARALAERQARDLAARAEQLERDDAERRRRFQHELDLWQFSIEEERRHLDERERDLSADEADLASRQASFGRFRDELVATREKLAPIVDAAKEFVRAAAGMRPEDVVPAARPAVAAALQVVDACRSAQRPASIQPATSAAAASASIRSQAR